MAAVMTSSGWGVSLPGLGLARPGQRPYSSMTNLALSSTPTSDSSVLIEPRFRRYPISLAARPRNSLLVSSARDSNSLPSFSKKSIGKRRSSSCRDDFSKLPKSPASASDQEYPSKKNSALFSPYSPLPAIGEPASARGMKNDGSEPSLPNTSYLCDPNKDLKVLFDKPRLLRERTYDVLEPRFVRGPSDQQAREEFVPLTKKTIRSPDPEQPQRRPLQSDAMETDQDTALFRAPLLFGPRRHLSLDVQVRSQPEMIDDVELPTSPPAMEDEDFESVFERAGAGVDPSSLARGASCSSDLAACADSCSRQSLPDDAPQAAGHGSASQMKSSRSLLSLKEDYKGKLKKFWSKF